MTFDDLDEGFRDTYLSVDIDYWMACPEEHVEPDVPRFFPLAGMPRR